MTLVFWALAALMVAAALAVILPPLLRRQAPVRIDGGVVDAALHRDRLAELESERSTGALGAPEYEEARQELERAALEALSADETTLPARVGTRPVTAVIVAMLVPTVAFGLYFALSNPAALEPAAHGSAGAGASLADSVAAMVGRLEARLRDAPEDPEGWGMLARSYVVLERPQEARAAFARAVELGNEDPSLLVGYAQLLGQLADGDLRGEASALIARALAQAPDDAQTVWLAGAAAFQNGDYGGAVRHLERLPLLAELGAGQIQLVDAMIARASAAMSATVAAGVAPAPAAGEPARDDVALRVEVDVDPALRARIEPGDTLFVFARAPDGPPMPLAIARLPARDLPAQVRLDDSRSMSPRAKLSGAAEVVVTARVSKSGNALAQSGDLEGRSVPVRPGQAEPVAVRIDSALP